MGAKSTEKHSDGEKNQSIYPFVWTLFYTLCECIRRNAELFTVHLSSCVYAT